MRASDDEISLIKVAAEKQGLTVGDYFLKLAKEKKNQLLMIL